MPRCVIRSCVQIGDKDATDDRLADLLEEEVIFWSNEAALGYLGRLNATWYQMKREALMYRIID